MRDPVTIKRIRNFSGLNGISKTWNCPLLTNWEATVISKVLWWGRGYPWNFLLNFNTQKNLYTGDVMFSFGWSSKRFSFWSSLQKKSLLPINERGFVQLSLLIKTMHSSGLILFRLSKVSLYLDLIYRQNFKHSPVLDLICPFFWKHLAFYLKSKDSRSPDNIVFAIQRTWSVSTEICLTDSNHFYRKC